MIISITVSECGGIRERNSERSIITGRTRNAAIMKWEKLYIEEIRTHIIKALIRVSPHSSCYTCAEVYGELR